MARLYLDCDMTPPRQNGYVHSVLRQKLLERAIELAKFYLATATEGQIGLYDNELGHGFKGYVIKRPGEEPYFEGLQ